MSFNRVIGSGLRKNNTNENCDIINLKVFAVGELSITLRARTWAANPRDAYILDCDLLENIKDGFDKEGIVIPWL